MDEEPAVVVQSFLTEIVQTTVKLFVIVDPIGTVPIVVALTKKMRPAERRRNLRTATYVGIQFYYPLTH